MTQKHEDSIETPYGWVIMGASLLIITMAVASNYLVVVGLKPMADAMDWPRWVTSSAYSVIALGSGTGGILIGLYADKRGIWLPVMLAGFSIALGTTLVSRVEHPLTMLALCFVFIGVFGNGAVFSPLIANTTRWFDRRRGIAVAIVMSGQNLAGAVWAPTIRYGIETYGWRETWALYGIVAGVCVPPLALLLRRRAPQIKAGVTPPPEKHAIETRWPPLVAQGLLCLAIIGCCVAMAMPLVHIVAYCGDLGFGIDEGAQMLSLLLACGFFSRMLFGWLSDRIGGLKTIFLGAGLQALALTLFAFVDTLAGLYLISALFGLVFGGIVPSYALATRQLFPARQASARIGVIFMAGYIGMASGGLLGGVIFDLTLDYRVAFAVGVAFNLMNLLCLSLILGNRKTAPGLARQPAE
ncbi:MAG: MFS transporter [Alphaproteobacteria bacterium]|nr:MFS transporter [Alphaproteobacteria bacterium]MCB9930743.1 MFS transporter [Alphaproteobacteria bacterium]